MNKCTELLKNGQRSLVEVRDTDTNEVKKYVVCSNFDNSKAFGSKWELGHYFDVWSNTTPEEQMKAAALYLYDVKEPKIPYERLSEIATRLKDWLMDEEDLTSVVDYLRDEVEISESEAEYFGIKKELFPTTFDVYKVEMIREQRCTIKVVVPSGTSTYDLDEYIDTYNMDYDWGEEGEWEIDDYSEYEMNISREYFDGNYSTDNCWNADDIEDME